MTRLDAPFLGDLLPIVLADLALYYLVRRLHRRWRRGT